MLETVVQTEGPDFYAAALSATLSKSLSPGSVMVITLEPDYPFSIRNCDDELD